MRWRRSIEALRRRRKSARQVPRPKPRSAVGDLQSIIEDITRGLQQSEQEMRLMMKAEGL